MFDKAAEIFSGECCKMARLVGTKTCQEVHARLQKVSRQCRSCCNTSLTLCPKSGCCFVAHQRRTDCHKLQFADIMAGTVARCQGCTHLTEHSLHIHHFGVCKAGPAGLPKQQHSPPTNQCSLSKFCQFASACVFSPFYSAPFCGVDGTLSIDWAYANLARDLLASRVHSPLHVQEQCLHCC